MMRSFPSAPVSAVNLLLHEKHMMVIYGIKRPVKDFQIAFEHLQTKQCGSFTAKQWKIIQYFTINAKIRKSTAQSSIYGEL